MKISLIIIAGAALLAIIAIKVLGINNLNVAKESEISFHQGNWDDALKLAKQEDKLVFLNISASWCGPCKLLKSQTFTDAEAGAFYNASFINVALDGEIGEGIKLAQRYAIKGYPTLLFVDGEGQIVAQTAGYHNARNFIELGKKVTQK